MTLGSLQALGALYSPAKERALRKQLASLDAHCRRFVAPSPFVVLSNVVATGRLGLRCLIPGVDETLRVDGTARLSTDPTLLARFAGTARPPRRVVADTVQEAYLHCAKALRRSKPWDASQQVPRAVLPRWARC
jgi:predicted pyridoxine 5'-phosphate oxidase superfamily flavin-nucleotide-binding protein